MEEFFSPAFAVSILPRLLLAAGVTVKLTLLSYAIALIVALPLSLARISKREALSIAAGSTIEFIRGTPMLIQLFLIFFGLPKLGVTLQPVTAGVLALSIHYGCYIAEVYRGGLQAVNPTQSEAAWSLSLSPIDTLKSVLIPQAIPPMIPALGTYLIGMFKDAALLASISVFELLTTAKLIGTESFRYTEPMTIAGLLFLGMSLAAAGLTRLLERIWIIR
ncbi:MAG: ectoine/hydroxyectoine ABC transporter permease subunit EhuD [Mesorhizobium sp.]|uniref:ectoine/hydroxyectoine ABC transporter permease subunit EhuD n=1 Tax=unclassified Mesorhizobium TaxID=325217 RepID=UPI000FCC3F19|nr:MULTISPECIES: ectoine/hydroxyectoine ABC transporter permease subunit EhuD [unclassified Mesorhizobium]RUW83324.1 ectoine/hydroxyectoine ABC transporter permease subunit EhuD [Mesorhizobium sp. M1E.F.Ca.ET.063.01.1.1]TIW08904.1 MAG: ectoine/hydroxyectoine ABC transporter permease subunit EhuD [Mesorhizobium sp.]